MTKEIKLSTLYLTRNGLLEPLGQSQILPYLRGISRKYQITLITFEKKEDLLNKIYRRKINEECKNLGIYWLPQKFNKNPQFIAPLYGFLKMLILSTFLIKYKNIKLIHARSYLPTFVAVIVGYIFKLSFIFDMRALWLEELIADERISRGSVFHNLLNFIEKICLKRAAAVVVLTNASENFLKENYAKYILINKIIIIPTCVDLDRFKLKTDKNKEKIIGCLGSILNGWFNIDLLASFFATAALRDNDLQFQITTKDDHKLILNKFEKFPALYGRLRINTVSPEEVPEILKKQICSVMFYAGGQLSEIGRSPTRMAEILAVGLPVVTYAGVGDVDSIIKDNNVGVILKGCDAKQIENALDQLEKLLNDPNLDLRCRKVAEEFFSLRSGIKKYLMIYENSINNSF